CFHSMEMFGAKLTPIPSGPLVALVPCTTGTGIAPPARHVGSSPDSAERSGSARLLTRSLVSSADKSASMLTPCVFTTWASSTPNDDAVEPAPGNTPLLLVAVVGREPRPVAKLTLFVLPNQLMPRSRPALRSTSRI